jgi:hypothetical protein
MRNPIRGERGKLYSDTPRDTPTCREAFLLAEADEGIRETLAEEEINRPICTRATIVDGQRVLAREIR